MKKIIIIFVLCCNILPIFSHGYLSFPVARQYKCFRDGNFYWPSNGDKIPDDACRNAYKKIYYRYRAVDASSESAATTAQYMFHQYAEYAAIAGPQYADFENIKRKVVPHTLCGAGAADRLKLFGDKSGMDEPYYNWKPDVLLLDRDQITYEINIHFCATVVHEPSYFEVYVTKHEYDRRNPLTWNMLDYIGGNDSTLLFDSQDLECESGQYYSIPVNIPYRPGQFILYVRWQRIDTVGEGFYNCADLIFKFKNNENLYAQTAKFVRDQLYYQTFNKFYYTQYDNDKFANIIDEL